MVGRDRNEAVRRRLAEGIDRSRRLVERYRALMVRLHDPSAGAPVLRYRPATPVRPGRGSSG